MQHTAEELGLDLKCVQKDLDAYRGLPLHTYTDARIFDLEMSAIFGRYWQFFVPAEKVETPGDVVAGLVGRTPVLVTRDQEGVLHGFVNACRHRGHTLADADRQGCKLLRCPYHAWAYRLDGTLAAAPEIETIGGFEKSDLPLRRVAVAEWGQAVFVNPDPNARPFAEAHPRLAARAAQNRFDTDPKRYRLHRMSVTEQRSNWKLWYDNGTECYHCGAIHGASFAAAYDVSPGAVQFELSEHIMSSCFVAGDVAAPGVLQSRGYRSFQIFPGAQIIQQDDVMIMGRMTPLAPDRTRWTVYYLAETGADLSRVDQWVDLWEQTYAEDAAPTETQQDNIQRGAASQFLYVKGREDPAIFMNRLIWQAYSAHLGATDPA